MQGVVGSKVLVVIVGRHAVIKFHANSNASLQQRKGGREGGAEGRREGGRGGGKDGRTDGQTDGRTDGSENSGRERQREGGREGGFKCNESITIASDPVPCLTS